MRKKILIMIMLIAAALFNSYGVPEEVGRVSEIDRRTGNVTVTVISGLRLNIGDRLQIETDEGRIVLEVTFPMLTLSKCKIRGKGKLSQLSKGMKVYRYSKDEPVEDTAVKPAEDTVEDPGKTEVFGKIEFCYIPGGTYMMGSPESEEERPRSNEEKQHKVNVSSFWIGKYEVTQKQYKEVMGTNPSNFTKWFGRGDNLPVESVSWYDAVEFCNKLSIKHGLRPYYNIDKSMKDPNNKNSKDDIKWTITILGGNGFRLPTEAEWEYACRAGTTTAFHYGNKLDSTMANFAGDRPYNADKGVYRKKTTPVGSFKPNAFGLYDMHGNVLEWCFDWYRDYSSVTNDPLEDNDGVRYRVWRGGGWYSNGKHLRSANRFSFILGNSSFRSSAVGFRLVRSAQ